MEHLGGTKAWIFQCFEERLTVPLGRGFSSKLVRCDFVTFFGSVFLHILHFIANFEILKIKFDLKNSKRKIREIVLVKAGLA